MDLARFPRVALAHAPTPLEPMDRLRRVLGKGPRLFVKRDDATGLAGGGNKTRKLEHLLGAALAQWSDTVITTGGVQSNHVRQTAAAAARLDLACELVLTRVVPKRPESYEHTGNVLLDRLLGAEVHLFPGDTDRAAKMAEVAEAARSRGAKPYVIPTGGSTAVGALGYARAALELAAQAAERDLAIDCIVHASSSGGTQAGLVAGLQAMGHPARVIGIDVEADAPDTESKVRALAAETARLLGHSGHLPASAVQVEPGYAGPGYGIATSEMVDAVRQAARSEGLVLDPVYSGKAMAGLLGLIEDGAFDEDETVVFLHTGGLPGLFGYTDVFDG
jgi:L-cysteate sulfo-lyase